MQTRHVNALKVSGLMSGARPIKAGWQCLLGIGLLVVFGSGCGGYRLGPSNGLSAREQSVFVQPFTIETLQPHLEDDFTRAVRKGLQREGTYQLGSRGDCDILMQGVITRYAREGLSYNPSDLTQVVDYNLVAVAHVTAFDRLSGRKVLDQDFSGSTQVRAGQDLTSAERQAMPLLANKLAETLVDALADGSW